ncbi:hypothetical protein MSAN_01561100 [Mycena sanguinolenta]|uniref:DUF7729 domain-containing protein n=1 Tax=Mycena sanguinolenta TaxID=230812 RepID=A0A8H7CX75_9AGAR|nr:hypothetical protein MSAN_01561100 [Mycena sanguinolenta]
MFTPPPSPGRPPSDLKDGITVPDAAVAVSGSATHPMSPETLKRRIGRRTRWTVILVPVVLVLITLSTRYLTHPAAFDMFSEPASSLNWESLSEHASDWTVHKRHPPMEARDSTLASGASQASSASLTAASLTGASGTSSTAAPASSELPISEQTVPTVPATPPTLPTPFPQPFDSSLSQNFSSLSCFNFFSNMTNTAAFRSCRPFSLLLQASEAFLEAQEDLDSLNSIVWGTCNTTIDDADCSANMAWFASNLQTSCATDISQKNSMAMSTLIALNAFDLMRSAGCLVDPTTDTYCYLDAVRNSNPSDTYFFSLPLGIGMPSNTIASCSACTKSLMGLYYSALTNSSESSELTSLQQVYPSAAKIAVADCGTAYATLTTTTSSALPLRTVRGLFLGTLLLIITLLIP